MKSNHAPPTSKAKSKKPKNRLKTMFWLLLLVLVGVLGYAGLTLYKQFDGMLTQVSANSRESADAIPVRSKPVTLLLLGVDTRKQTGSLNTDVIMVATLNPTRKSGTLVSIPRDTYMKPAGFKGNKANSFYASVQATDRSHANERIKKIFGDYLQIPIDYVGTINFQGFEDIVDAVGGITVDVDMNMRYMDKYDGTNINLRKGRQELSGKQALDFIRYRHSNTPGVGESNDMERNARQQQVVGAIVDKLKSFDGIRNAGEVLAAVGGNLHTDIPKEQLKALMMTYFGIGKEQIETIHLEGQWKSPYVYVQPDELANARQALHAELDGASRE